MMTYKHILLASDLIDKNDKPVSEQAHALAKAMGAKLSIVHVVELIYNYGIPPGAGDIDKWQEELENSAKKRLRELGGKLDVPEERLLCPTGTPSKILPSIAQEIEADLIVVGTHGRHGITGLLVGNTAENIVHSCKIDVLTVRVP